MAAALTAISSLAIEIESSNAMEVPLASQEDEEFFDDTAYLLPQSNSSSDSSSTSGFLGDIGNLIGGGLGALGIGKNASKGEQQAAAKAAQQALMVKLKKHKERSKKCRDAAERNKLRSRQRVSNERRHA